MTQQSLTWWRALALGVLTFAVTILVFLYIPHWILTALNTPSRGIRVWMATGWIALALILSGIAAWRSTAAAPQAP
ncbi:MAG: hypothetical protein IT353_16955 [Gemmatimonadaceae bacterium]|nr:hypothetical protein [Gemmatimonadaceae bacterium]